MKITKSDAIRFGKHGVNGWVYDLKRPDFEPAYIEVAEGHFQEFYHRTSAFTYYIIEGSGTFYLEDEPVSAGVGDVVFAPAGTRIWYLGTMKMMLITAPTWSEDGEVHVRYISHA